MRIIAGKYKKSNLNSLDGLDTRPTRDMVREALFSSVDVEGKRVLDLFSGSGAIGIEALSRNADDVIFNDLNIKAVRVIESNLAKFNETRKVYNLSWEECLHRCNEPFDFIYIDPPYAFEEYEVLLQEIMNCRLLNDNGIIVVEVRKDCDIEEITDLIQYRIKKYGINKLLYYKKR